MQTVNDPVLLLGCGGGYDIYAGYFLYKSLQRQGKTVHLANYSFTDDLYRYATVDTHKKDQIIVPINRNIKLTKKNADYFPEYYLASRLDDIVYACRLFGPKKVVPALVELCTKLEIKSIVLIDAGHDALLFGDEDQHNGSPLEDMSMVVSTLLAANELKLNTYLACVSIPTESIPLNIFYKHLSVAKEHKALVEIYVPSNEEDICAFEKLLDSTSLETRSIPNECILACCKGLGIESKETNILNYIEPDPDKKILHYKNPRLSARMSTDFDYPPIYEWTSHYYIFDLSILKNISPLISHLYNNTSNISDLRDFNICIINYYKKLTIEC